MEIADDRQRIARFFVTHWTQTPITFGDRRQPGPKPIAPDGGHVTVNVADANSRLIGLGVTKLYRREAEIIVHIRGLGSQARGQVPAWRARIFKLFCNQTIDGLINCRVPRDIKNDTLNARSDSAEAILIIPYWRDRLVTLPPLRCSFRTSSAQNIA